MKKQTSPAQKKAQAKYDSANTTQVVLKLNKKTDVDILTRLAASGNKQGYIKALIRKDIAAREARKPGAL